MNRSGFVKRSGWMNEWRVLNCDNVGIYDAEREVQISDKECCVS